MSSHSVKLAQAIRQLENIKMTLSRPSRVQFSPYHTGVLNGFNLALNIITGKPLEVEPVREHYVYEHMHDRLDELEAENEILKARLAAMNNSGLHV